MIRRGIQLLLILAVLNGCEIVNVFNTPDTYMRHWEAGELKKTYDESIQEEIRKEPPEGWKGKPYSRTAWNQYWNSRIYYIYDIGTKKTEKAYRGPSGPEWITYIITQRRAHGLPELKIEERNRDRVPKGLTRR